MAPAPTNRNGKKRTRLSLSAMTTRVGSGRSAPRPGEQRREGRDDLPQDDADDAAGDDDDGDRIDHRRLDLALQLDRLLDVGREPLENRVEDTARLARRDHVGEQRIEGLRMLPHRVGERRARLDVGARLQDHRGEILVRLPALPRMSRHCTSGRPASIITENWRVKTARFFADDLLADLADLLLGCGRPLWPSTA